MPVLQANNISIQFDNGTVLFDNISCSLNHSRVALVGRNGVGKSILAQTLVGHRSPNSGSVVVHASVGVYSQLPSSLINSTLTIAQYLGIEPILDALDRIEAGECSQTLFDLVADNWQLKDALNGQLKALGLPQDATFPCCRLSGGELARLQLWQLFEGDSELLLLDEPSNHLDTIGRHWLLEKMRHYRGAVIVISHDRQILREVDRIWELSSLGLTQYGGNYDFYKKQKEQEASALERQLDNVASEQKRLERQAQKSSEKADQRAAQGNKLRRDGSQPKILLDGMRNSAENSASNRNKNLNGRRESLSAKHSELSQRYEQVKAQKLYLGESRLNRKNALTLVDAHLPFGLAQGVHLSINSGDKVHLSGANGCGKSTLLNVIRGYAELVSGEIRVNSAVCYLDQHYQLLDTDRSLLENLTQSQAMVGESEARTLLAGIGFRRDEVHRKVALLSGGEKMKLAMLIVSHQSQPAILLLDEPDNHLDLDSKHILARTLASYNGSFILVSHDDEFVHECGVDREYRLI